ncbi:YkgJ family cysteine cluster protein [Tuwongella immobilis]|uniref:YkgJ family cysteine cluster protein n=1 Tax=Tuwongella immobilis TaxID=692036 RepID=A0A6C2YNY4_9BACT|nr:YkgJ family cysteine cluster protein [Tuwongella immobilis]VIP02765.1 Uncharacterized protein OS=Planctomyces maris DSM 8797 GN=PM8797T_14991 PE=4 SV=1: CxxCxxCC [Tuwongella immobilis]VTS02384.1 Uncharacterized protein OS=Planctomyces maris DSM 8797 GN=PM8797T_14991 PE=4 SV=1: CxxCxxCC [Tuwongella immobilis]
MAMPVRSLPVLQNWDCHNCTDCCREYRVTVTPEEQAKITAQGWLQRPEFQNIPLFVREGGRFSRKKRLNHRADGACIFLKPEGGCRIHSEFGSDAKPLACRIFPFVFVPTGDHWRLSLRYACPSAAANQGRALNTHLPDLRGYANALEIQEGIAGRQLLPPMPRGQSMPWEDVLIIGRALRSIVESTRFPLETRLRQLAAMTQLGRKLRFEKITGQRLRELMELLRNELDASIITAPEEVVPPTWIGRLLFRQQLAIYARKDTGTNRGLSRRGRLALLQAAWRFAQGTGTVPPLHGLIPNIRFEEVDQSSTELPEAVHEQFSRFYAVKLESLQCCGPTNFHYTLWDGVDSLLMTFPTIVWLSRCLHQLPIEEQWLQALRMVDDNFGFNPLLGSGRQKWALRTLASWDEIAPLIAWQARRNRPDSPQSALANHTH